MTAATYLITDPTWPWSLPGLGVSALASVAMVLAALTVWTYLGHRQATRRRVAFVLGLRLAALAIALVVVLRPSLARDEDDARLASKLILLLDVSASMNEPDELNNTTRYEHVRRLLTEGAAAELLKRLPTDRKIEVVHLMGDEDLQPLKFPDRPTGKRTDIGGWLHDIWQRHGSEANLRGLVLLTDGADNGTRFAALDKAAQFRGGCPIHAFGLGRTDTAATSKDVAVEKVWVEPTPVYAKGKMTVKAALTAPGFQDAVVFVSLLIEEENKDGKKMKQIVKRSVDLRKQLDRIVAFDTEAPDRDGELKVMVKVDPLPGDNPANNAGTGYVNVSKEGVRILWVEGKKRWEAVHALKFAISKDRRLNPIYVEKLPGSKSDAADEFLLDKQRYDVIVIGDIPAKRFADNPAVFDKIVQMVQSKGTGLLMLGGYDTFSAGGWQNTPLNSLLPVQLGPTEQIEAKVKVVPTPDGEQFLLKFALDPAKQKELWAKKLEPLDGLAPLGVVDKKATVHAMGETVTQKFPVLVSVDRGLGRVMVFAGDTTHLSWRRSKEAVAAYELFWTQLMLWMAKQEHSKGFLAVKPDTRRLEMGKNATLGFTVTFTKGTGSVIKPNFKAKVIGPKQEEAAVQVVEENNAFRGYWSGPPAPGEYRVVVEGEGIDDKKQPVSGKDAARFMVYEEDRETLRPAADHDLLEKIAAVSGGKFLPAEERHFVKFLEELAPLQDAGRLGSMRWPDWRRNPASHAVSDQAAALWQSSALPCFLAFASLLCLEWFLRRRWGMV